MAKIHKILAESGRGFVAMISIMTGWAQLVGTDFPPHFRSSFPTLLSHALLLLSPHRASPPPPPPPPWSSAAHLAWSALHIAAGTAIFLPPLELPALCTILAQYAAVLALASVADAADRRARRAGRAEEESGGGGGWALAGTVAFAACVTLVQLYCVYVVRRNKRLKARRRAEAGRTE